MSGPCTRPECGGEVHTDGWGTPIQCPADRRCPRCDCPDGATQCDHCKTCPHATIPAHLCPQVHRVPHDAHDGCPGWMPDDGTRPEVPPAQTPLDVAEATAESLRYQIRRAREALGDDEPDRAAALEQRLAHWRRELQQALGMDLTRDWDDIRNAAAGTRRSAQGKQDALDRVLRVAEELEAEEAYGGAWDSNQDAARRIRAAITQQEAP